MILGYLLANQNIVGNDEFLAATFGQWLGENLLQVFGNFVVICLVRCQAMPEWVGQKSLVAARWDVKTKRWNNIGHLCFLFVCMSNFRQVNTNMSINCYLGYNK